MFNLLKLLTKSGRQSFVREAAKNYLTPSKMSELAATGVAKALDAGVEKLDEARCAKIVYGCNKGTEALAHLTQAIDPQGDNGHKVSEAEKALIQGDIRIALESLVTEEAINAAIEKAVALVP